MGGFLTQIFFWGGGNNLLVRVKLGYTLWVYLKNNKFESDLAILHRAVYIPQEAPTKVSAPNSKIRSELFVFLGTPY